MKKKSSRDYIIYRKFKQEVTTVELSPCIDDVRYFHFLEEHFSKNKRIFVMWAE